MKTCKDCIHFDICDFHITELTSLTLEDCTHFKDKSLVFELPCKVGDTVYRVVKRYIGDTVIVEGEAFEFTITHEYCAKIKRRFYFMAKGEDFIRRNYSLWCDFDDFGTTVFPTREAAEQALKENKNVY